MDKSDLQCCQSDVCNVLSLLSVHFKVLSVQIADSLQRLVYGEQCAVCSVQCVVCRMQCVVCSVQCTVCTDPGPLSKAVCAFFPSDC